jgi:mgtE-like transporter
MMTLTLEGIGSQVRLFLIGLVALLISAFAASIAGMYLGSVSEVFAMIPGLMVLLPPSINMRGSISGVLASRLSSSMHLGEFEVDFHKSSALGGNLRASFLATLIIAFVLGLLAYLISTAAGLGMITVTDFVVISVISGVISGLIVMGITLIVTLMSYRYGLDLDMIAAPTVTTSGDIVTLPILVVSALVIVQLDPGIRLLLFWLIVGAGIAAVFSAKQMNEEIGGIIREIVPLLSFLCVLGTLAGLTYALELDRLVTFAALLILIPPFMGSCGSIGGILCSRLATGMHMGSISPHIIPEREIFPYFISTYLYAAVLLPLLAFIAHGAALLLGISSPGLVTLLLVSTGAGFLVLTLVSFVAYGTATMSFRYGLDPDNFGIPVITSVIDLVGAAVLVAVINILV